MRRRLKTIALTAAFLLIGSGRLFAADMGLTPSHVVGLWTNVNNCLIVAAQIAGKDQALVETVRNIMPRSFKGKKPSDVLENVAKFREKLDRIRSQVGLKATVRFKNHDGKITPSTVFLNSGHALDGLVGWVIKNTDRSQLISQFYKLHSISGKTPSDAYSMVDLANRRLDEIVKFL